MSANRTGEKGFYGWINVVIASATGIIGGFYIISFGYLLPFLVEDFGWNRGTASLAATINLFVMGSSGPLAGFFIVKYGARRSIVLGNILGIAGFTLLFFHSRLWELFLAYGLLLGMGAGFGGLLATTTVINNWFVKKRALALSIYLGAGGVGGMVMGPALMRLIEQAGWRTTVLAIAALILVFSVILPSVFIRNKPQDLGQVADGPDSHDPQWKGQTNAPPKAFYRTPVDFTAREAIRTRSLWLLIVYFCMNMLAMQALMTHQIAHMFDIGISATMAATALSVMSAVMTLGQLIVGFISKRFSMHSIAIGAEGLKLVGMVIVIFAESLPIVFVYMIVLGLGFGAVMAATMNIFPNYFGVSSYPKIMGFVRLWWAFIGGAGAPLAGYIRETTGSYIPAFQAVIVVVAIGFVCLVFAKAPVHPSLKGNPAAEQAP